MPRIAFFVAKPDSGERPANDNHERLPRAFGAAGWDAVCIDRDSLALHRNRLVAASIDGEPVEPASFDLFFVLGFGTAATFLDRMQLLRSLDQRRFVNTVDALVYQHGKASLILACPDVPQPASHLSNDPGKLEAIVAAGGEWIAKPPASSFGRDVYRLRTGDSNTAAILGHLTRDGRYALLQERVAAAESEEKRLLIVAGTVIGAYGKCPADHRGNLDAGASASAATLTIEERAVAASLAARLDSLGVRFATADLAGPCVLEINVANPGWLRTFEAVAGVDKNRDVVAALGDWAERVNRTCAKADALPH